MLYICNEICYHRSGDGMRYENIVSGKFIDRPNRFIANVQINGQQVVCHVKNTGRCKELLKEGVVVYLQHCPSEQRKTAYDLIAVRKGDMLVNIDSQAPNKAVLEWLIKKHPFGENMVPHSEVFFGDSRFDFMLESKTSDRKLYLEVKGCTLEKDGIALFPDAQTERGVKHIQGLMDCIDKGYEAAVMILVQMKGVSCFSPNYETHRAFGEALVQARKKGVTLLCYDSIVTPETLIVDSPVEIRL